MKCCNVQCINTCQGFNRPCSLYKFSIIFLFHSSLLASSYKHWEYNIFRVCLEVFSLSVLCLFYSLLYICKHWRVPLQTLWNTLIVSEWWLFRLTESQKIVLILIYKGNNLHISIIFKTYYYYLILSLAIWELCIFWFISFCFFLSDT